MKIPEKIKVGPFIFRIDEEQFISAISATLLGTLRENPKLVAYLVPAETEAL